MICLLEEVLSSSFLKKLLIFFLKYLRKILSTLSHNYSIQLKKSQAFGDGDTKKIGTDLIFLYPRTIV